MAKLNYKDFIPLAAELRKLFPSGGVMKLGHFYSWRGGNKSVAMSLMKLYNATDTIVDKEEAIKATENYVKHFKGNYTAMKPLESFIYNGETSELLSFIENPVEIVEKELTWNDII